MLKTAKKIIGPAALQIAAMALPAAVFAQIYGTPGGNVVPPAINNVSNIVSVIRAIIQFILVVAFVLAFVFLLIGGIRWITAGGDEKNVAAARNMITAALIGLVVVLVAFALIKLVETFFGVSIISNGVVIPRVEP